MNDDLELLSKWRGGDAHAGQELFRRHTQTLYRFFQNKAAGGVEDLVQQTMLACLQSHMQFEQRSSFRSYLLGVARYQLFDYYRRTKLDAEHLEFDTVTVHDLAISPSSQMAKAGEERILLEALRRLPINCQIALELSYWEELTGPELAEILEVPVDTAYSRLRRARQLLREELAQLAESPEQLQATQTDLARWASALRKPLSDGQPSDDNG
ncbi:MAG: polymerase, sigma-24 subunit, subfamily [Myxococcaceae bacterium]|nr:polymerase, sigma-24 subunit, subfamily [Myxococcaceae bacterium]